MDSTINTIEGLYVAFYHRAADQEGLDYWLQRADESSDGDYIYDLAAGFAQNSQFEEEYGSLNDEDFVKAVYQNVLNGVDDDPDAIAYWTDRVEEVGRDGMIAEFVQAVLEYDGDDADGIARQEFFQNKVDAATSFTETLAEESNPLDLDNLDQDSAYLASQAVVESVVDSESLETVLAFIDTHDTLDSWNGEVVSTETGTLLAQFDNTGLAADDADTMQATLAEDGTAATVSSSEDASTAVNAMAENASGMTYGADAHAESSEDDSETEHGQWGAMNASDDSSTDTSTAQSDESTDADGTTEQSDDTATDTDSTGTQDGSMTGDQSGMTYGADAHAESSEDDSETEHGQWGGMNDASSDHGADSTGEGTVSETTSLILSQDEIDSLVFMYQEEKLAGDVYEAMGDLYDADVFDNIAASEDNHQAAVGELLSAAGVDMTQLESLDAGVYDDASLQSLYDDLIAQGSQSLDQALEVGVAVEETDIEDLQSYLSDDQLAPEIADVYENLLAGSYNHLDAFQGQIDDTTAGL